MTASAPAAAAHVEAPGPGAARDDRLGAVAVATVLSAMTIAVLDAGMTNVALPSIGRALKVAPAAAILVVTIYQAGLVMALLPLGSLGERFGHRRVFTLSVALFGLASALCAVSPSLAWLLAARFVQGLGGAGIMALGVALLRFTVPRDRLGAAIGWNALTVALASAAGPSVGALILSVTDWPWLFAVNLPIAVITLFGARALPRTPRRADRLDLGSMALNALMFALAILAAQAATRSASVAAACLAASLAALVFLIRREAPKAQPLFPLDLLRGLSFRLSVIASLCCFTAQSAGLLALPFLLQQQLHQTPLAAGLYITVWPLSVALAAVVSGRLSDRMSTAWLCALGGVALSAGLAGLALGPQVHRPMALIPFIALAGVGFGLFQSPNNRNMFLSAPAERSGAAGGMQGTARVSGQTVGALAMALLFSLTAMDGALQLGFALAALLALAAGLVSLSRGLA